MKCAAAADDGAHDRAPAARARLARTRVDLELALHPSLVAAGVDVVARRGATETNAFTQRPPDRLVEPRDLIGAQRASFPKGMDPRAPQRLDRVNVPDAGDGALVEEQHLD